MEFLQAPVFAFFFKGGKDSSGHIVAAYPTQALKQHKTDETEPISEGLTCLEFCAKSQMLLSAGFDNYISIWDPSAWHPNAAGLARRSRTPPTVLFLRRFSFENDKKGVASTKKHTCCCSKRISEPLDWYSKGIQENTNHFRGQMIRLSAR